MHSKVTFGNIRCGTKDCHYIITGWCRRFRFPFEILEKEWFGMCSHREHFTQFNMVTYELDFRNPLEWPCDIFTDSFEIFHLISSARGFRVFLSNMEVEMVGNLILLLLLAILSLPCKSPQFCPAAECCLEACGGAQECDSHILLKFCLSVWTSHPNPQNHPWEMGREKLRVREVGYFKILPKTARPENPWQNRRTGYFNTFLIPEIPC